jgi:hypothetical protein
VNSNGNANEASESQGSECGGKRHGSQIFEVKQRGQPML